MKYRILLTLLATAALAAALCSPASAANLQATPLPFAGGADDLIVGPDGALWFANRYRDEIDRFDPGSGALQRFPIPHGEEEEEGEGPTDLVAGVDGEVWYLTDDGLEVGRISSAGVAERVEHSKSNVFVGHISVGPGGGVWESVQTNYENTDSDLRRLQADGTATAYPYEGQFSSGGPIATAADGSAWIGDWGARISSATPAGAITSYETPIGSTETINSIAFAPDGSVWYAGFSPEIFVAGETGVAGSSAFGGSIGHLVPGVGQQAFKVGSNSLTGSILAGPDGAMWFATVGGVGRIEASGAYQLGPTGEYQPGTRTDPHDLVYGPGGALWFIDNEKSALVKVAIDGALFPPPPAPPAPPVTAPTRGPKMALLVRSQHLKQVEKQHGIALTCALQGTGKCSLVLTIAAKDAKKLHLKVPKKAKKVTIAKTSRTFKKPSALTFVVKLAPKVLKALRHLHKPLPVTVSATTTSPGHSSRHVTKKIAIKP